MIDQYDVICPHCCGCFHETNGHFVEGRPAKGHMFSAKQHIVDSGWTCFPPYDSTEYMDIVCPSCGQPYLDSLGIPIRLHKIGQVAANGKKDFLNDVMDRLMDEYDPELPSYDLRACAVAVYAEVSPPKETIAAEVKKRRGRPKVNNV